MRSSIQSSVYEDWEIARDHQNQPIPYPKIKYHVQTHDKAIIYLGTTGTESQRRDIWGRLATSEDKPTSYELCLQVTAKTDYPAYSWLNQVVMVARAMMTEDMLVYDAYQLE
ncbi:hypothetical protein EPUS_01543 [Endocarpon pusillum Z07020]|uniref:Uncharacterized protein n=1 Tax=Endocarpon pusillum (strain Z07020 / HMAS-L-300199) TaxID=1263415 RepID=U1GTI7_ENDPU|nr:uncharacterized protein EPUS_01543 [Endocarpon pusillum Z07020]ERF75713.1 hypothetical protein EPUS_01543 [Endocarpon pusillum Z07020]